MMIFYINKIVILNRYLVIACAHTTQYSHQTWEVRNMGSWGIVFWWAHSQLQKVGNSAKLNWPLAQKMRNIHFWSQYKFQPRQYIWHRTLDGCISFCTCYIAFLDPREIYAMHVQWPTHVQSLIHLLPFILLLYQIAARHTPLASYYAQHQYTVQ